MQSNNETVTAEQQVQRYYRGTDEMAVNIGGDWVLYSDYERQARRIAELERDLLFANDAAKKGDDARAILSGMRMEPEMCPHGMPLNENICGPCSEGRPNRRPAAPPPAALSELGWLIEAKISPALWLQVDPVEKTYRWTNDANEAVRFARKADAENVIGLWSLVAAATEHMWCGGPAAETPAPQHKFEEGGQQGKCYRCGAPLESAIHLNDAIGLEF